MIMILKYLFDRIVAFVGLLILWPILVVVAVLIKIMMPGGPVFFVQDRVGRNGKLFRCHKFRTMTVEHNGPHVSIAGEERITLFGARLRHHKLDELPELWDVLVGNMSFVGPRPLISSEMRAHRLRLEYGVYRFRPGLTGWAQVNGRDDISLMKKTKFDKEYCDSWSIGLDIKIMFMSVKTVITQEGFHEGKFHRR